MKNCIKGLSMLFIIAMFFGCSKDDSNTTTETTLRITVKDDAGNPVPQAQVMLYGSQSDMLNMTNQILTTQTTNSGGVANFSPVTVYQNYFWRVNKDCRTNIFSTNTNLLFLTSNTINYYDTTISETGILTFTNNSSNPYNVYVNNVLQVSNMSGNSTQSYYYQSGNYTIRVEQQSGYILYPTIITYTGTLTCGGVLTTTFPN